MMPRQSRRPRIPPANAEASPHRFHHRLDLSASRREATHGGCGSTQYRHRDRRYDCDRATKTRRSVCCCSCPNCSWELTLGLAKRRRRYPSLKALLRLQLKTSLGHSFFFHRLAGIRSLRRNQSDPQLSTDRKVVDSGESGLGFRMLYAGLRNPPLRPRGACVRRLGGKTFFVSACPWTKRGQGSREPIFLFSSFHLFRPKSCTGSFSNRLMLPRLRRPRRSPTTRSKRSQEQSLSRPSATTRTSSHPLSTLPLSTTKRRQRAGKPSLTRSCKTRTPQQTDTLERRLWFGQPTSETGSLLHGPMSPPLRPLQSLDSSMFLSCCSLSETST